MICTSEKQTKAEINDTMSCLAEGCWQVSPAAEGSPRSHISWSPCSIAWWSRWWPCWRCWWSSPWSPSCPSCDCPCRSDGWEPPSQVLPSPGSTWTQSSVFSPSTPSLTSRRCRRSPSWPQHCSGGYRGRISQRQSRQSTVYSTLHHNSSQYSQCQCTEFLTRWSRYSLKKLVSSSSITVFLDRKREIESE